VAQRGAEGVGQDREHNVEVDAEGDCAGEGVEAEGLDGFGEALFAVHPAGVGVDDLPSGRGGPVGEQEGGLVVAQPGDGELADRAGVGRQLRGWVVVQVDAAGLVFGPAEGADAQALAGSSARGLGEGGVAGALGAAGHVLLLQGRVVAQCMTAWKSRFSALPSASPAVWIKAAHAAPLAQCQ